MIIIIFIVSYKSNLTVFATIKIGYVFIYDGSFKKELL